MYDPVGFRHVQNLLSTKIQLFGFWYNVNYTVIRTGREVVVIRLLVLAFWSNQAFDLENIKEVALGGSVNDIYRVFPYIILCQLLPIDFTQVKITRYRLY